MASVANVTAEHHKAALSPAKVPQAFLVGACWIRTDFVDAEPGPWRRGDPNALVTSLKSKKVLDRVFSQIPPKIPPRLTSNGSSTRCGGRSLAQLRRQCVQRALPAIDLCSDLSSAWYQPKSRHECGPIFLKTSNNSGPADS